MSDSLDGSIQIAGRDILLTVRFDRRGTGLSLLDAVVIFRVKHQDQVLLTLSIASGLTRTVNTIEQQVLSAVIPGSVTARLANGTKLKAEWEAIAQGRNAADETYQQSFTVKRF